MMKTGLFFILFIGMLSYGCKRRPLTYDTPIDYAELIIEIDWSVAFEPEDKPTGVSVWLYPQDGSEPIKSYSANVDRHTVTAKVGYYDIVVFNLTPYELSSTIGFRGEDKFSTLEVYSQHITTTREPTASRGVLTQQPQDFAPGLYRDLEVTKAMVEDTRLAKANGASKASSTRIIKVTPKLANHRHAVRVEIEGFKNLSKNGVYGELSGLAEGYFIGSEKANSVNARQKLMAWDQIDHGGTKSEGEAFVEYVTWGLVGDGTKNDYSYWTGLLELLMMLVDDTTREFNIQLNSSNIKENSSSTQTNIELVIEIGFGGENPPIVLPDVEPTGGETGFLPEVNPWDEVDVPVVVG